MARLKVFISSTYYDLKHIRSTMETFVEDMGYEAVLSEKGSIAYNPSQPLDESCYRDAQTCDILVLIIGGRYGVAASSEETKPVDFYDRYDSITKKEFQSALDKDIPVYILIEKSVYGEFETFQKNRDNKDINYAHVQNVNVFFLIEDILSKPKNNATFHFDKHVEIISWLKLQWSGLFKDFLQKRNEAKEISTLSEQVNYLSEINTTLKRYMEEILSSSGKKVSKDLIDSETKRLEEIEIEKRLKNNSLFDYFEKNYSINFESAKKMVKSAKSVDDFILQFKTAIDDDKTLMEAYIEHWKNGKGNAWPTYLNEARELMGLSKLKFEGD